MAEKKAKRDRGRILSETGWQKLEEALQQWEVRTDQRRTFEKVAAEAGLDPGTVAKIFKRREGADLSKIERLLRAFQLNVEAIDHCPVPQGMAQSADPNFVGRAGAIADLNALVERGARVIVIQARGGVGKTSLARKYLQQEFGSFLEFPIAKETKDIASIESLIEEKLKQLGEEPGREFLVSIDRLKRKLQSEAIGILIDNLEPALDSSGKFIEPHRRYVELLRVLSDPSVQSTTLITSRERLYEPSVTVQHYLLNSLDVAAWEQFFQLRQLSADAASLAALHRAYGGNAKAMEIISSAIQTDYSGDVAAYWQANQDDLLIERALEDLVTQQFDRLQQLDQDAYNLLCRMGCYRYQDVPTVQMEGLFCLLWDVFENRHRRVIKVLQDLSLVELKDGEYWLHPVIRSEAISRLRLDFDWEKTVYKIAEFWALNTRMTHSLKEALKASEAYYHYIEIGNFSLACEILIREIRSKWVTRSEEGESVIWSFYRLGLYQKAIFLIDNIKHKIVPGYSLSRLNGLLGVMCWAMGEVQQAIHYHEKSREFLIDIKQKPVNDDYLYKIKVLEVNYFINLGLCKMAAWELEEAIDFFEKGVAFAHKENIIYYELIAKSYLLFARSHTSPTRDVLDLAKTLHDNLSSTGWGIRGRGYVLLSLGKVHQVLGESQKSLDLYREAIDYAEDSSYIQVKAKALTGISEVYRNVEDFTKALTENLEAIQLLEQIGAKSDLAEAHYQIGLTYQAISRIEDSDVNFQRAIQLFAEMEAPKQVDRVRRSMQNNI